VTAGRPPGVDVGPFASVVADIARTLEAPHDAEGRLLHVLRLVRSLIPCDRCALRIRTTGDTPALLVQPECSAAERATLADLLHDILGFMEGGEGSRRPFDARVHLALPVIGLDEILGVLLVDRDDGTDYESHHLQLLATVSSQLGAYVTMVRLHHETVRQTTLLVDREQQLRGAARFREEFIGVIGHDLRNPLSAIRTGAGLLLKRGALDPRDITVVERLSSSAERMSRMIDELMDFARGRLGGGIPLRRTCVDLHELCREVIDEAHTAHGRTVRLEAASTPAGHWDRDRLAQLISNLVGNAVQHSPADGQVTVRIRTEDEHAVFEVHNEGPPIPADHIESIFEPFRRGAEASSTGLGLGLYIVERIVHAHGGAIAVRSTPEEGTTFEVRLPRRRANDRIGADLTISVPVFPEAPEAPEP
jgi:signal transduction histidine kinase